MFPGAFQAREPMAGKCFRLESAIQFSRPGAQHGLQGHRGSGFSFLTLGEGWFGAPGDPSGESATHLPASVTVR